MITSTGTAGASDAVTLGTFSSGDATQLGYATASESASGTNAVAAADLTFKVNNQTVTLAHGSTYTGTQIAAAIQSQVGTSAGVSASYASGKLVITSTGTAGASDAVSVGTFSSGDATQLGFAGATETDHGSAGHQHPFRRDPDHRSHRRRCGNHHHLRNHRLRRLDPERD